ncbi:MAG: hypothetical protein LBC68_11990 [Prevotellaceae bacterium]|jgi:hypothetical protein|nr:hypothetical protein [Prevotellaceae bacterium]
MKNNNFASDITLANVETLALGEDGEYNCSRIKNYCSCYNNNGKGQYVGQSITECESYISLSLVSCQSCSTTACGYGNSCR